MGVSTSVSVTAWASKSCLTLRFPEHLCLLSSAPFKASEAWLDSGICVGKQTNWSFSSSGYRIWGHRVPSACWEQKRRKQRQRHKETERKRERCMESSFYLLICFTSNPLHYLSAWIPFHGQDSNWPNWPSVHSCYSSPSYKSENSTFFQDDEAKFHPLQLFPSGHMTTNFLWNP